MAGLAAVQGLGEHRRRSDAQRTAEPFDGALEVALTKEGGPGRTDQRHELGPVTEAYAKLKALRDHD